MSFWKGITLADTRFGAEDAGLTQAQIKKDWNVMYWIGGLLGLSAVGVVLAARAEGRRRHG